MRCLLVVIVFFSTYSHANDKDSVDWSSFVHDESHRPESERGTPLEDCYLYCTGDAPKGACEDDGTSYCKICPPKVGVS